MRFVTVKNIEQQDMHRIRAELHTAKANQIRGLVAEYGLVAPTMSSLRAAIPCWLEDAHNGLTDDFRILLQDLLLTSNTYASDEEADARRQESAINHTQTTQLIRRLVFQFDHSAVKQKSAFG